MGEEGEESAQEAFKGLELVGFDVALGCGARGAGRWRRDEDVRPSSSSDNWVDGSAVHGVSSGL